MKKIFISLITCFASLQSLQAIPSNLGESLIQYQSIISSPLVTSTIPQNEFVIDIKRLTKDISISIGTIRYEIVTRISQSDNELSTSLQSFETKRFHHCHHDSTRAYLVVLELSENPMIGPPLITVVSVTPVRSHETFQTSLDFHAED